MEKPGEAVFMTVNVDYDGGRGRHIYAATVHLHRSFVRTGPLTLLQRGPQHMQA